MAEKNAIKEGAKRAQTFSAMHKSSGIRYFCTTVDVADGNVHLLKNVMEGANNDKKAKQWGKYFLSSNDNTVVGWGNVPSACDEQNNITLDIEYWTEYLIANIGSSGKKIEYLVDETNPNYRGFVITIDPDSEQFAFKLSDEIVQHSINLFREKGIIRNAEESEDEDYGAAAGIEW